MVTVDQIRAMLQQVILAHASLDELDEWLTRESWDMHRDSTPEAISLVGQIELILAAYDEDMQSEEQAISALRELNPVLVFNVPDAVSISTSSRLR